MGYGKVANLNVSSILCENVVIYGRLATIRETLTGNILGRLSMTLTHPYSGYQGHGIFNLWYPKNGDSYGQWNLLMALMQNVKMYGIESCPVLARDERSIEFTDTRSFMKLQTGSAAVVSNRQKYFHFMPIIYQIDVRTATFLEKFMSSNNYICMLFDGLAGDCLMRVFSTYGDTVRSVLDLCCAVHGLFFQV